MKRERTVTKSTSPSPIKKESISNFVVAQEDAKIQKLYD